MTKKEPRHNYQVKIPPNATKEEIVEFMKEFNKKWFGKDESSEPASKPDEASS